MIYIISTAPVNITLIVVALIGLLGTLIGAGYFMTRAQKRKRDADTALVESQIPVSHAQYDSFIAEAAEKLQGISDAAITRLESELNRSNSEIESLQAELHTLRSSKDVEARTREAQLQQRIGELQDEVADLRRRLEARGVGQAPTRA